MEFQKESSHKSEIQKHKKESQIQHGSHYTSYPISSS